MRSRVRFPCWDFFVSFKPRVRFSKISLRGCKSREIFKNKIVPLSNLICFRGNLESLPSLKKYFHPSKTNKNTFVFITDLFQTLQRERRQVLISCYPTTSLSVFCKTISEGKQKRREYLVKKKHVAYNDNVPVFLSANDGILERYSQSISVKSAFSPGTSRFLRRNK